MSSSSPHTDVLVRLTRRLKKIGIEVEYFSNVPWIYLDTVNGNKVKERYQGEHGFTVAFLPPNAGVKMELTHIGHIFHTIRKYKDQRQVKSPDGMVILGWCIYRKPRYAWGKPGEVMIHESRLLELEFKRKLYKSHEAAVEAVRQSDPKGTWADYLIVPAFTYKLTQI